MSLNFFSNIRIEFPDLLPFHEKIPGNSVWRVSFSAVCDWMFPRYTVCSYRKSIDADMGTYKVFCLRFVGKNRFFCRPDRKCIDQKIVDHFAVFPNVCKKYRFYNAECRIIGCRCEKECSPSVFGYGRVAAVCNFYRVEIVRGVNPHRGRKQ